MKLEEKLVTLRKEKDLLRLKLEEMVDVSRRVVRFMKGVENEN